MTGAPNPRAHQDAFSGGCQCGAVRFSAAAGPARSSVCHCRMCQRAVGNAFAPLIEVARDRVEMTGKAQEWASSNISVRGFCGICGTPLYLADIGGERIEFMAGALDPATSYAPAYNHGIESRAAWLADLPTLPGRRTFFTEGEVLMSHQTKES